MGTFVGCGVRMRQPEPRAASSPFPCLRPTYLRPGLACSHLHVTVFVPPTAVRPPLSVHYEVSNYYTIERILPGSARRFLVRRVVVAGRFGRLFNALLQV